MRILIVKQGVIPPRRYGGTERVIWCLGKELVKLGHTVSYLVDSKSKCEFAPVIPIDKKKPLVEQVPLDFDVVHFNKQSADLSTLRIPYIVTMHGNSNTLDDLDRNTVFVSRNHALRFNSESYVHNGLDWDSYFAPQTDKPGNYFHFLGNAAWKVKNVVGAIDVIKGTESETLRVLGGVRFNFNMGIRFTFSRRVRFEGMVGGSRKDSLLSRSKGLIFPVRWHEPFGLAIIESMYYGCPVFGTPYGSLPELVAEDVGFLSDNKDDLIEAVKNVGVYSRKHCHEYARDGFNSRRMALEYLKMYEKAISGRYLNPHPPQLIKIQKEKLLPWN